MYDVVMLSPHLTCRTSVVWLVTAQCRGGSGGVAGITENTQGTAISPMELRAQQYSCPNWWSDLAV